ncbi:hypothetical protein X797_005699 [Metarhizium robertsii]|nr:hypothetical protein X797_005699 [Metarhizium robertsii]
MSTFRLPSMIYTTALYNRVFSTSARVHPSILPHLRQSRRPPFRWLKAALVLCGAGYIANVYIGRVRERRIADIVAAETKAAELQRRNNALLDVYGDRSSLEELEKAVQFYEKK